MNTQLAPASESVGVSTKATENPRCGMCPHDLERHDRISLRFCAATSAASMTRSCVCPES